LWGDNELLAKVFKSLILFPDTQDILRNKIIDIISTSSVISNGVTFKGITVNKSMLNIIDVAKGVSNGLARRCASIIVATNKEIVS